MCLKYNSTTLECHILCQIEVGVHVCVDKKCWILKVWSASGLFTMLISLSVSSRPWQNDFEMGHHVVGTYQLWYVWHILVLVICTDSRNLQQIQISVQREFQENHVAIKWWCLLHHTGLWQKCRWPLTQSFHLECFFLCKNPFRFWKCCSFHLNRLVPMTVVAYFIVISSVWPGPKYLASVW